MKQSRFFFLALLAGAVALGVAYLAFAPSETERLNQALQEER